MATNSPLQGVPLPEVTDADNVPYDLGNAVSFMEGRLVMRFTSAADRDAKVKAPVEGMLAYLGDVKVWTAYKNAAWTQVVTTPGAWIDWSSSFTITAATTNPTKGNSTYNARYTQLGKTVTYSFNVVVGSTFAVGSGMYFFALPVPANLTTLSIGAVQILKNGVGYSTASLSPYGSTTVAMYRHGDTAPLGSAGPGSAWGANDQIRASLTYEAA